jgi:hypothetical protein
MQRSPEIESAVKHIVSGLRMCSTPGTQTARYCISRKISHASAVLLIQS